MPRTPAWIVELAILVMVLVVLGSVLAPAHRISIWMDDEFTGFVPPISNRIAAGMVLYEKGGHLPIPPLSLVFFHLVSSGEATWFLGSLWNYIFQCAPLLLLYATLTTLVSRPIPFLAALSGIPIFLAMGKSVLYDSFSWKWRRRSPGKVKERAHEEATEALHAGRESRHPEAPSAGAGADLGAV